MYWLPSGSSSLRPVPEHLGALLPAQLAPCVLEDRAHFLLLNTQGQVKVFDVDKQEAVHLPASASAMASKQFKSLQGGSVDNTSQVL